MVMSALPSPSVPEARLRVLFLIRQLEIGGAERQLAALARNLPPARFDVTVVSLYGASGPMWDEFTAMPHVRTVALDKRGRWDTVGFLKRLLAVAREVRPHLVHGYMLPANELSLLVGRAVGARVAWGIRISDQDFSRYTRFRRTVHAIGTQLSRFPDLVIANSFAGRSSHVAEGYPRDHFIVIPNGIDVERFRPDAAAGQRWRASVGAAHEELVVALPARLDPMKDHPTFLAAAAQVLAALPERAIRFVCAGNGPDAYGAEMRALSERLGVADRVTWAPAVREVIGLYSGADVVASASAFGEGFPNILGEAMACGTPCVAAASGDAAVVIGDAGVVVPPRSPDALAAGLTRLLALDPDCPRRARRACSCADRHRIHGRAARRSLRARVRGRRSGAKGRGSGRGDGTVAPSRCSPRVLAL